MGKGDKKSKKGKITIGSYGVSRPSRKKTALVIEATTKPAKMKKTDLTEDKPKKKTSKKEETE